MEKEAAYNDLIPPRGVFSLWWQDKSVTARHRLPFCPARIENGA